MRDRHTRELESLVHANQNLTIKVISLEEANKSIGNENERLLKLLRDKD